ncbi:LPS export ABC transporter periplasmic protein LptC [Megasphaera sp. ASD88]|uniref:LPS export ABC transporter periplasmic protein LptC n=1 Tax=Megasphaera TaxID=906 RepID=UPI000BABF996|nr:MULTISPECIES: LPS export ABC transporter periplasmic protein LptC [Megasphaera]MDN0046680.1 LPS export ABC transporter periplasmic protein LptC [Megasphaera hexanoica]PAV39477.1 LPS export ABC transporter periplasmic protein LptC [Megasphaera sp. ASD88]HJE83794.1 LPS export ABC transporter periplasmic protein LptC [Megasphaera stantonii]
MTITQLKQNKGKLIGAACVIAFAALLYSLMEEPVAQPEVKADNLVEFEGSELVENKNGKLVWKLTADKIMIDPQTEIMYFTNPKALLVDEEDGTEMTITSPNGVVDRKKHTIEIKPPVSAATNRNDTLQTEGSVYYNMNTHMVKGGKVVMNRHDNTSLRADAFETTTSMDKVTLTGHAQVTKGE